MATTAPRARNTPKARKRHPHAVDTYERVLAVGSVLLLSAVVVALLKGRDDWARIPVVVWAHLGLIIVALALTPVVLLRTRGDTLHRQLGWVWTGSMLATAIVSLFIRLTNPGSFSLIHILSAWTIIQVPIIIWTARTHQVKRHRSAVRGMVTGSLLVAGFFTFPFNRLLGQWLFS